MIWIGRAFISKTTGWSWDTINILYYPEFIKLIHFYADPGKTQEKTRRPSRVDDVDTRLNEIKKKNEELIERGSQKNRKR